MKRKTSKLYSLFDKDINSEIIITLCYDNENDDIFEIQEFEAK